MTDDQKFIYEKLREEEMDLVKRQDTYLLAAYTLTITIWTVGIERNNPWVVLLPLFILFVISLRICEFRDSCVFLSSYIAICLEKAPGNGWEYTREKYFEITHKIKKRNKNPQKHKSFQLGKIISRTSLCLLSLVSIVLFWKMRESDFSTWRNILINIGIAIGQLIIFLTQVYKWYKYIDTTKLKKEYMNNWEIVYKEIIAQNQKEESSK